MTFPGMHTIHFLQNLDLFIPSGIALSQTPLLNLSLLSLLGSLLTLISRFLSDLNDFSLRTLYSHRRMDPAVRSSFTLYSSSRKRYHMVVTVALMKSLTLHDPLTLYKPSLSRRKIHIRSSRCAIGGPITQGLLGAARSGRDGLPTDASWSYLPFSKIFHQSSLVFDWVSLSTDLLMPEGIQE